MTHSSPGSAARPTAPHLTVWRWHVTMLASILHRASGMALYVGALVLAGWAVSLASGPDVYAGYTALLGSIPGEVALFGLTVAVFYHLASGVRHLIWDWGQGFELATASLMAWASIAIGVLGAVLVFILAALEGAL